MLLYAALTTVSAGFGLGMHIADIPTAHLPDCIMYLYIGEFFAIIGVSLSKTSFAVTLLRLATKPWHTYFLWFSIITINIACAVPPAGSHIARHTNTG
jgi:branched-subunit amino acid permease